ncbi:MAG: hypothetical protein JWP91_4469 [Fibrobacteres bacterium]|nr:hypothetical protein [Fibrobacterota bacterium]
MRACLSGEGWGIFVEDMQAKPSLPSVFEYLDYRRYLSDYLTARRLIDANFSLRAFALKAGLPLSNSSFFSKVIAGKRNLTQDIQFRIAKALKLPTAEIKYFGLLVQFSQSKDPEGKQHVYSELAKYAKSKARIIDKEGYEYYSRWQNSIVRAYFGIDQKESNPAAIGKRVFPRIPAKEVEEAVKLLLQLGMIRKTANGYALRDPNIATERENKDFVGKLRILEMLRLAQDVFNHVPPSEREYSAMTVYISGQGYQALKEKIRVFREEVKSLVGADKGEDRIYTLGLQFFPNYSLADKASGSAGRP